MNGHKRKDQGKKESVEKRKQRGKLEKGNDEVIGRIEKKK